MIRLGYESIGIERDPVFYQMAERAIPKLAALGAQPKPSPATSIRRVVHDERTCSEEFRPLETLGPFCSEGVRGL